ncbi:MAG TPA: phosphatase PAP2 family protein [Thermomicrobiales bacterium]|nr:phosphatase PAP2 family protein [Thermomicrobiales bacterium]
MALASRVPHVIPPGSQPVPIEQPRSHVAGTSRGAGRLRVAREVLTIVLGALLYFFVRGLMETQVAVAFANAETLIALEQSLGLFHEPSMQGWITGDQWLVDLANRIYIFGHWPVIAGTMAWMVWKHRDRFAVYRSALLLSGAIGIVFFVLLPMAPPRFLVDQGFVDTVTTHSEAYRVLQPPSFTNQYAAMPSLHVGWNLLMGIAIVRHASTLWFRAFGYVMPLVMWLATIVTANHYILDGVVGSTVALTGLALAWRISRPRAAADEVTAIQPEPYQGIVIGQGWNRRPAA